VFTALLWSRRTKAERRYILALIAPLGKLGRFEEAADLAYQVGQ